MTTFTNDYRKKELRNIQIGQTFIVQDQTQTKLYMRISSNNLLDRIYGIEKEDREEYADTNRTFCYVDLLTGIVDAIDFELLEHYDNYDITNYNNCAIIKGQLMISDIKNIN